MKVATQYQSYFYYCYIYSVPCEEELYIYIYLKRDLLNFRHKCIVQIYERLYETNKLKELFRSVTINC